MGAVVYSEQNRAFNYAVLASIVLHAVLLFGISLRERARPAEPQHPIIARLVELPAPAPVPAVTTPPPQVEPVKPRPAVKSTAARPVAPKPVVKEEPAPQPEPAAEPAAEERPVAQMESAAPVSPPAAPPVITGIDRTPAQAPPAAEPAPDPGSLEKYKLQLLIAADNYAVKYKRYPRMAVDNTWNGIVALRMVVGSSGRIASLTVTKTSGYDVLDQHSLEMYRKAAEVVPVPPILRGKEFAFDIRAVYRFRED